MYIFFFIINGSLAIHKTSRNTSTTLKPQALVYESNGKERKFSYLKTQVQPIISHSQLLSGKNKRIIKKTIKQTKQNQKGREETQLKCFRPNQSMEERMRKFAKEKKNDTTMLRLFI